MRSLAWILSACLVAGCSGNGRTIVSDLSPALDSTPAPDTNISDTSSPDLPGVDSFDPDISSADLPSLVDQKIKWVDVGQDIPSGTVSELVTCRFQGSTSTQQCNSSASSFCSGISTCVVKMSGASGTAVMWKSTCGGYANTTLDGKDEAAIFQCAAGKDMGSKKDMAKPPDSSPADLPTGSVSELVTCQFHNSGKTQTCYSSTGQTCSGITTCVTTVSGKANTVVTWKSSCGGYATTTLDGIDEAATFTCP